MLVEIYQGEQLIKSVQITQENEKQLYNFLRNLRVNSKFNYSCSNNDAILSYDNMIIKLKGIANSEVLFNLLNSKIVEFMYKNKPNSIHMDSSKDLYSLKYSKDESNDFVELILSVDKNDSLTPFSKAIIDNIINKELESWEQTFHAIDKSSGLKIYYDDKNMVINKTIYEYIKPKVEEMKSEYLKQFDGNPFRRMK